MRSRSRRILGMLLGVATVAAPVWAASDPLLTQAQRHFKPLLPELVTPPPKPLVELGRQLYYDPRLSISGAISCATCHSLASYGVDNLATSLGHKAQPGDRNAPTVLNAVLNARQFWDGRAPDLVEQAKGPILNPLEMGMPNQKLAIERIRSIPGYQAAFLAAFPQAPEPNYQHVAEAIAAFERTMLTPSRFDRFLEGDASALDAKERQGLGVFMRQGCVTCHQGVGVGGTSFQKFGIFKPYADRKDLGRYDVTKRESDKYVFKAPSLRNVARTYPYFHDGGVWQLPQAVRIMGETQLGKTLSQEDVAAIVAFLESLTGDVPASLRELPVLPPSGPDTPKPER